MDPHLLWFAPITILYILGWVMAWFTKDEDKGGFMPFWIIFNIIIFIILSILCIFIGVFHYIK